MFPSVTQNGRSKSSKLFNSIVDEQSKQISLSFSFKTKSNSSCGFGEPDGGKFATHACGLQHQKSSALFASAFHRDVNLYMITTNAFSIRSGLISKVMWLPFESVFKFFPFELIPRLGVRARQVLWMGAELLRAPT